MAIIKKPVLSLDMSLGKLGGVEKNKIWAYACNAGNLTAIRPGCVTDVI
jgi:hypothetical protein